MQSEIYVQPEPMRVLAVTADENLCATLAEVLDPFRFRLSCTEETARLTSLSFSEPQLVVLDMELLDSSMLQQMRNSVRPWNPAVMMVAQDARARGPGI